MTELATTIDLPKFVNGGVVRKTPNFRLVMGYKQGQENTTVGQRFYIEPQTYKGQRMLMFAIPLHHEPFDSILTRRKVPTKSGGLKFRTCVRANFHPENIPALLMDETVVPSKESTSMPSLKRMEECITSHPDVYTFSD